MFLFSYLHMYFHIILITILLCCCCCHFSHVRLCATPQMEPTRLPCPWDSQGKNTGVGCHFLLQRRKVKSESEVAQSCPTLRDPMDRSPPGSSAHGKSTGVGCHCLLQYFALILKEKCYFHTHNHAIKILQTGILYYFCIILDSLFSPITKK